jgi:hypothetical protein
VVNTYGELAPAFDLGQAAFVLFLANSIALIGHVKEGIMRELVLATAIAAVIIGAALWIG